MKIALIHFGNEENYGLLFAGGELLLFNQEIHFFDAEESGITSKIIKWGPDYLFFSPLTTFYSDSLKILQELKNEKPNIISAYGGHHAIACPKIIEHEMIDVVVVGPVRGTIGEILSGYKGTIKSMPTTPDDMPTPARDEYYRDIPRLRNRYRKFMLSMSGCPWNCSYCSSSSSQRRKTYGSESARNYFLSRRPIKTVIDEAKDIVRLGKTAEIEWVDDDIFTGADYELWLPEFVDVWEKEIGLPMYVSSASASVLKVSDKLLSTLKRIVYVVGMGVQAIRPESLKLFNRGWDNEKKMKAAYDRLVSFGFLVNLQGIVGLPIDDPVEDAIETLKGIQRIGPGSICSVYPLMVYPGTELSKLCEKNNLSLNPYSSGDTNTGIPSINFPPQEVKRLKNICKLSTFFVKYNIDERWIRALIDIDYDDRTSRALSMGKYYECIVDRLGAKGEEIFYEVQKGMNLRY